MCHRIFLNIGSGLVQSNSLRIWSCGLLWHVFSTNELFDWNETVAIGLERD